MPARLIMRSFIARNILDDLMISSRVGSTIFLARLDPDLLGLGLGSFGSTALWASMTCRHVTGTTSTPSFSLTFSASRPGVSRRAVRQPPAASGAIRRHGDDAARRQLVQVAGGEQGDLLARLLPLLDEHPLVAAERLREDAVGRPASISFSSGSPDPKANEQVGRRPQLGTSRGGLVAIGDQFAADELHVAQPV